MHTDAYSGYNKIPGITSCFCWAHLSRYFVEAIPKDLASHEATLPSKGLEVCNKLFEIEKAMSNLKLEERKLKRLETEKPILEAFWSWINPIRYSCLPKSKISKATEYVLNHKECFMNYLLDGNCVISNNVAENSIRSFTLGRKNWLFSGSPKG